MSIGNQPLQGESALTEKDAHEILRNDRRRAVIEQLRQTISEIPLRTLAEDIAERETGESPPPRNIRESVYNSLHQTHLPKLNQRGIVDYDKDRKIVSLRQEAREVNPYMDVYLSEEYCITWTEYYRSVAVVGLMVVTLADLGFPVVGAVDIILWASFFLFVVAVSTAYQFWTHRWTLFEQFVIRK